MSRRFQRWILPSGALLTVAALIAATGLAYLSVEQASTTVALGEGDALVRALNQAGRFGPPRREELDQVMAEQQAAGLRYVAFFDREGSIRFDLGTSERTPAEIESAFASLRPGEPRRVGRLAQLTARPPPGPPPPRPLSGLIGAVDEPGRHGPALLIEFEPVVANRLRMQAIRTLVVGIFASLVLLTAAAMVFRRWLREEDLELRLERDRRLAALGEMSAVLAHEIRNPLASLKGHAQLLVETLEHGEAPEASPALTKAERIVREATRLESLVSDLLEFVRAGRIEPRPIDPTALLRETIATLDSGPVTVDAHGAPSSWTLDPERIKQVLLNVLRNARQASPEGAAVKASVRAEEGSLVFEIRDHGDGLPAGSAERIFEPFHTTRSRGTGLGLAVAKRLVTLHGGDIRAFDHPAGGAVFRISLPA